MQPVLGALTAIACPQPEDVAVALAGDRQRDIDGSVGDLPVADLDVDRVDEERRSNRIRPSLSLLNRLLDPRQPYGSISLRLR
jgi:hypothetical protein